MDGNFTTELQQKLFLSTFSMFWNFYNKCFSIITQQKTETSFPGTVYFVSAGFTTIAIVFCVTINYMLKGRKMTDLTKYVKESDVQTSKDIAFRNGLPIPMDDLPSYNNAMGITSF